MGNISSSSRVRRGSQGFISSNAAFSSISDYSESFPCTLGSNDSVHFSLQDHGFGEICASRSSRNFPPFALQVKSQDKNGVLWSTFADSGWELSGSIDEVGSKAVLSDRGGHTLAVVLKRNTKSFLLLSKQPAYRGQRMQLRTDKGVPLYPWASTEQESPFKFLIRRHDSLGVTYLVDFPAPVFGVRTVQIVDSVSGQSHAIIQQKSVPSRHDISASNSIWNVVSGPSLSPGLIMCIVAIINNQDMDTQSESTFSDFQDDDSSVGSLFIDDTSSDETGSDHAVPLAPEASMVPSSWASCGGGAPPRRFKSYHHDEHRFRTNARKAVRRRFSSDDMNVETISDVPELEEEND